MTDLRPLMQCLLVMLALGCERASPYERMRTKELARGDTLQELFLSYQLGMTQQAFYDSSWALNARGLVMQGPRNQNVQYKLPEALPFPATMLFYPDFENGRVVQMRIRFGYDHWAPWNRRLQSDILLLDVKDLMMQWYNPPEFVERTVVTRNEEFNREFVTVDANRQITLGRFSDQEVYAIITALHAVPVSTP